MFSSPSTSLLFPIPRLLRFLLQPLRNVQTRTSPSQLFCPFCAPTLHNPLAWDAHTTSGRLVRRTALGGLVRRASLRPWCGEAVSFEGRRFVRGAGSRFARHERSGLVGMASNRFTLLEWSSFVRGAGHGFTSHEGCRLVRGAGDCLALREWSGPVRRASDRFTLLERSSLMRRAGDGFTLFERSGLVRRTGNCLPFEWSRLVGRARDCLSFERGSLMRRAGGSLPLHEWGSLVRRAGFTNRNLVSCSWKDCRGNRTREERDRNDDREPHSGKVCWEEVKRWFELVWADTDGRTSGSFLYSLRASWSHFSSRACLKLGF